MRTSLIVCKKCKVSIHTTGEIDNCPQCGAALGEEKPVETPTEAAEDQEINEEPAETAAEVPQAERQKPGRKPGTNKR